MIKRAVAVGINDYSALDPTGSSNLTSCGADADSMMDLLISAFGFDPSESVKLTDGSADSETIQAAVLDMLQNSEPEDVACFYYSGHGSRIAATNGKGDSDKFFEAIIPASGAVITDQDLFRIADFLEPSVVNFTVILDSCFSGGMDQETDGSFKAKSPLLSPEFLQQMLDTLRTLIPCGILIPEDSDVCDGNALDVSVNGGVCSVEEDPDKIFIDLAKTNLIAGCKFDELSWEIGGHGLMTQAFVNIVNASDFQITNSDLLDQLRRSVANDFNTFIAPSLSAGLVQNQTPQLRGQRSRMNDIFLRGFIQSE
jgi:Caspase domain.